MKKLVLLLILFSIVLFGDEYKTAAQNFIKYKGLSKVIVQTVELKSSSGMVVGYLYNLENGGYVLVSASKNASPIKLYSFENSFDAIDKNFKSFIIHELELNLQNQNNTLQKTIDDKIQKQWDFLQNYDPSSKILNLYTPGTNLLTTAWEQGYPYNKFLPKVNGQNVLAGCVQIAFGQVMKYHGFPSKGTGKSFSSASTNSVTDLTAYFNRYYNWDIMEDTYNSQAEYKEDEVGYLMRDLAVVNQAILGVSSTGAIGKPDPLVKYFGYSTDVKSTSNNEIGNDAFISILKDQMDKEQPVLFTLPGHMVVADGYNNDITGNWVHINMGWGPSSNTFYNLDSNIQAGGYNFYTSYTMHYDIKPCSEASGDCYKNLEDGDLFSDNSGSYDISGSFDTQTDSDDHTVFLKGYTSFNGNRGYNNPNNMYFYINIYNSKGELKYSIDTPSGINLPADQYEIRVSLVNAATGSYWYAQDGYNDYTVTVENNANWDTGELEAIEASLLKEPVIDQDLTSKIITADNNSSILINGYEPNSEDNISFDVAVNNNNLTASLKNNILTLKPNVQKGHSKVKVSLTGGDDTVEKEFDVFINDSEISFGKEFSISGMFESQSDYNEHSMILDGICTISGKTDGYSNQAFFTKLLDKYGMSLTYMSNTAITTSNLSADNYLVGASLQQNPGGYGSYYPYGENTKNYTLFISCPNADTSSDAVSGYLDIIIDDSGYEDITNSLPGISISTSASTKEDTSVDIPFSTNDADGDTVTASISQDPVNGSVDLQSAKVVYTPNNGYFGSDSFGITFDDGNGGVVTKTINITITEKENSTPSVIIETQVMTMEDTPLSIPFSVSDADGDSVTVTVSSEASNGTVAIGENSVTYTPSNGYYGSDSFGITFNDGNGGVVNKTLNITVLKAANNLPEVTINDSISTDQDTSATLSFSYTDADGDSVTVTLKTAPSYGSVIFDGNTLIYIPNDSYYGADNFVVSFDDGNGGVVDKTISVYVNPVVVNSIPVVNIPQIITTDENTSTSVFYSVYDANGDSVDINISAQATNGTAVLYDESNNSITYTPNSSFYGKDQFIVTFNDGNGGIVTKTIDVIVNKNNNLLPKIYRFVDILELDQDSNGSMNVVIIDFNGDSVLTQLTKEPENGSVSIAYNAAEDWTTITYSGNQGFYGEDEFTVTFDDQNGGKVQKM